MVSRSLPPLVEQLHSDDELIVVDNASEDGTPDEVRRLAHGARVIETGENLGYGAACNRGAGAARADLLCFLNPDAVVQPRFRDAIAAPLPPHTEERPSTPRMAPTQGRSSQGWAAWQALVTADGGTLINTSGGVAHFTGIAWAGQAGEPVQSAAPPPEPGFLSGACLAIPRETFSRLGGFAEEFFLYHEDVDLSHRVRLGGGRLGVARDARVDHEYEFEKGPAKWRQLERNRWATLIRTYPLALLFLLAPALAVTEVALLAIAARGGWLQQKLGAWLDVIRWAPRLIRERRAIQSGRTIGAVEFAGPLTAELSSAYLGAAGRSRLLDRALAAYWRAVVRLLGQPRPRT